MLHDACCRSHVGAGSFSGAPRWCSGSRRSTLPSVTGFVQPELKAKTDAAGKIVDVEVWYPCDLADQMLRWSGRR